MNVGLYMNKTSSTDIDNIDNGGAIAIQGFNYQNAVASLIAILNYDKDNFLLFIETKDDIEVDLEDKHIFIQVKGQNLSLSKLLSVDNKKCIFSKNIQKNHINALYHIVLLGLKNDQKDVIEASENIIFSEEYSYSPEQQNKIITKLKELGFTEETLNNKLPSCRIYFTPFKNKKEDAAKYLIGCMCDKGIKVDERGKILLNELFSVINQKAEKTIKTPADINKKTIDRNFLIKLFETNETYALKEEILQELYRENVITFSEKYNITKEFIKIMSFYKFPKQQLHDKLEDFDISGNLKEDFRNLFDKAQKILPDISKNTIFAILIDLYIQKLGENKNDIY